MEQLKKVISEELRARVLVDALPYIQKYYNKIVVIKYGGAAMSDPALKEAVMRDIVLLSLVGIKVVLVHGGGPEINSMLKKLGIEPKFVGGLRYTDAQTMEVVQMVLAGKVNKDLVSLLGQSGGKALGLCGMDGRMIEAKKLEGDVDLGFVGEITDVNTEPILDALQNGYVPVVSTIGIGEDSTLYNINADTAAAKIAAKLNAENVILMTDTRGLLRDKDDEESLIPVVQVSEVPKLIKEGIIGGGMIPKVDCCVEAVRRGVKRAFIIDGRIPHAILNEMLSSEGIGTMVL
ncbi:acetylglutamate kinase [Phocea massiliensis]|uniref:Acetylglutamate kinase n=1 Tax=Merdimmobilis hominis TaxID=2897707 RepID=A0A938X8T1_9FIRM|nr:acetylglutamate kinase [Merdimmobilis hominis]MBM6921225.1 acetylglutamate kinase [Merdimmobilis hominis]